MKKILYTDTAGSLWILSPVPQERGKDEPEDAFVARIANKDVPAGSTNVRVVEESEIPADRTFRNAWKPDLTVDMVKAKDIHRDHLREMRTPLFDALDQAQRTAIAADDKAEVQRLERELQALRDVTADPAIEAATTPEQLKAVIPEPIRRGR